MRFHFGPPPNVPGFEPERDGWTPLREPNPGLFQLLAVPIGIVTAGLLIMAWSRIAPNHESALHLSVSAGVNESPVLSAALAMGSLVGGFFALIAVHELLHAATMPGWGMTRQTLIGIWPSRLLFYAAHLEPLSRNRFLLVFAMPFLILSILPLAVCVVLRTQPPLAAAVSVVNGLCACGDLMGIAMISAQVPRDAFVLNQGWRTWWKRQ